MRLKYTAKKTTVEQQDGYFVELSGMRLSQLRKLVGAVAGVKNVWSMRNVVAAMLATGNYTLTKE